MRLLRAINCKCGSWRTWCCGACPSRVKLSVTWAGIRQQAPKADGSPSRGATAKRWTNAKAAYAAMGATCGLFTGPTVRILSGQLGNGGSPLRNSRQMLIALGNVQQGRSELGIIRLRSPDTHPYSLHKRFLNL